MQKQWIRGLLVHHEHLGDGVVLNTDGEDNSFIVVVDFAEFKGGPLRIKPAYLTRKPLAGLQPIPVHEPKPKKNIVLDNVTDENIVTESVEPPAEQHKVETEPKRQKSTQVRSKPSATHPIICAYCGIEKLIPAGRVRLNKTGRFFCGTTHYNHYYREHPDQDPRLKKRSITLGVHELPDFNRPTPATNPSHRRTGNRTGPVRTGKNVTCKICEKQGYIRPYLLKLFPWRETYCSRKCKKAP